MILPAHPASVFSCSLEHPLCHCVCVCVCGKLRRKTETKINFLVNSFIIYFGKELRNLFMFISVFPATIRSLCRPSHPLLTTEQPQHRVHVVYSVSDARCIFEIEKSFYKMKQIALNPTVAVAYAIQRIAFCESKRESEIIQ